MVLVMRARGLIVLLLLVVGCGNPFPPRTLVERPRVLGIRSDPADTDIGGTVTLTALVADKTGPLKPDKTTWVVCPLGVDCMTSASIAACWSDSSYPLPSGELTTKLIMPEFVAWLATQGFTTSNIDQILAQFNITVPPICIGFVVTVGDDEVRAVKSLPVHLDQSTPYNQNPSLIDFDVNRGSIKNLLLPETYKSIDLTLGKTIQLKPIPDESLREIFTPSGETPRQEDFVYSWFSTIGEFDYARTISAADNQDNKLDENYWSIPETLTDEQKAESFLWVVVRDGRFGIDWKVFTAGFNSTP